MSQMISGFLRLMTARGHRYLLATILALFTSCATGSPVEETASNGAPVVGGMTAAECSWPSTVQVYGATSCTGTLIHPRVVVTAAHCIKPGGGTARITFGSGSSASFSVTGTCKAGALGESGVSTSEDWGYCVLPDDDRVKAQPVIAPIVGCEADKFLVAGSQAWVVGFGATSTTGLGFGTKRQVEVVINGVDQPRSGVLDVGDATKGACHGDSGGPLYFHVTDGARDYGWRVAGSTSGPGIQNCDCNCSSTYVNIKMHVAAIEQNEGIDVTPCTNADGGWDPGPDCKDMQKDPANATGTFPNCVVTRTTDSIESCGPNTTAGSADGGGSPTDGATNDGPSGTDGASTDGSPPAGASEGGTSSPDSGGGITSVGGRPAADGGGPTVPPPGAGLDGGRGFGGNGGPDASATSLPPAAQGSDDAQGAGVGCAVVYSDQRGNVGLAMAGLLAILRRRRGRRASDDRP